MKIATLRYAPATKTLAGTLHLIDQTVLPREMRTVICTDAASTARAIRTMVVRGAPAIGIAAAYGMALEAARLAGRSNDDALRVKQGAALQASSAEKASQARFSTGMARARALLAASRPTAVNLFWALAHCDTVLHSAPKPEAAARALLALAKRLHREDIALNQAMGAHGAELLNAGARVLTHCNAGALATAGYGTALGVIRAAHAQQKIATVWVDETRPFLQGARLTAWELTQEKIPATLICDNMAASLMAARKVDAVIVGADRITANGDVANKIGTYGVAVLARAHRVPFYVAAPLSTFDLTLRDGSQIPIEERPSDEMTGYFGKRWAPQGMKVFNPAFDVTPARLVTAIITERGVLAKPSRASVARHVA